jgi:hypothetical protein
MRSAIAESPGISYVETPWQSRAARCLRVGDAPRIEGRLPGGSLRLETSASASDPDASDLLGVGKRDSLELLICGGARACENRDL